MRSDDVSPALQERLGLEGTVGLLELLETARHEWRAEVTSLAIERFERRLTEEVSGLRIAFVESTAALRSEFKQDLAALRSEFKQDLAAVRSEFKQELAAVRFELKQSLGALRSDFKHLGTLRSELKQDLGTLRSDLTHETSNLRVEMQRLHVSTLRWMFAFWVGQTAALAAIVAVMFQIYAL